MYCTMRSMNGPNDPRNHPEARRLRILRRAMGYGDERGGKGAFAAMMGWDRAELSQWENGHRPIPTKRALSAHLTIAGLDPLFLINGRMDESSMPIRKAIAEAEKAEEAFEERQRLARKG